MRLLNTLLTLLGNLRQPLANLLLQPLATVALLLALYAGWHVRDEGDVARGLQVAFVDTRANREAQQQQLVSALLQAELRQYAKAGRLIDQALVMLLQNSAGAARVRLGVIHNGVSGLTGISLLRYDVVNAVAVPGRTPGPPVTNEPLTTWGEFLPSLLGGKCQLLALADVHNFSLRNRLETLGANSVLACPVIDVEGKLLGAMFSNWDAADKPPSGAALQAVMDYNQRLGGQIASMLSLRGAPDRETVLATADACAAQHADPRCGPGQARCQGVPAGEFPMPP